MVSAHWPHETLSGCLAHTAFVPVRLSQWIDAVYTSFWFVPGIMLLGSMGAAWATLTMDRSFGEAAAESVPILFTGSPAGARLILSTIAGSMITVAGVVFSITIVALALASSQYGPRLLRGYMQDRANHYVLGTFVSAFLYSLLVLRSIRSVEDANFVPHISTTTAVGFAFAGISVLIFFIHHTALSIQANEVITRVWRRIESRLPKAFPQDLPDDAYRMDGFEVSHGTQKEMRAVPAPRDGYLQAVDVDDLAELARRKNALVQLEYKPGEFVTKELPLAMVYPASVLDDEDVLNDILEEFAIGINRTDVQDAEFLINQLVEVALRALSSGINDPFTATTCIDYLGSAMCRLCGMRLPGPFRTDEKGRLLLVLRYHTFAGLMNGAFDQVRQAALGKPDILIRLLEVLERIAKCARNSQCETVLHHAEIVMETARRTVGIESDLAEIETRFEAVVEALKGGNIGNA